MQLKTYFIMDEADCFYAVEISVVEAPREKPLPVRFLGAFQSWRFFSDHLCEVGHHCNMTVKAAQNTRQLRAHEFPEFPQVMASVSVDPMNFRRELLQTHSLFDMYGLLFTVKLTKIKNNVSYKNIYVD